MKKRVLFTLFLLLILFPSSVYAASCDYTYKSKLTKKGSNIMPSYTYTENDNGVTFDITLTNMNSDIYVVDATTGIKYYYNGNSEITIKGYKPGTKVSFNIYATDSKCIGRSLATKYVNLPSYNQYYKDPLCVGKENYSVCYKWNNVNITYEEFEKRVNSLYNEQPQEEEKETETKESVFDAIYRYLKDYYLFIIAGITVIAVITLALKYKKQDYGF